MSFNPRDHYFKKAKEQGFAARSVFKLEEIDQKFKILRSGQKVLDLGAAPGSWSQYAAKKIGPSGKIIGIDLTPVQLSLPNATFITADLRDLNLGVALADAGIEVPFDLVVSDMAPKTTGIRVTDQARSLELCELALSVALRLLRPGGNFVVKFFQSNDFKEYERSLKQNFERVETLKPKGTRARSFEIFLVGLVRKERPK